MRGGREPLEAALERAVVFEKTECKLDPQDARHRIVEPLHRYATGAHILERRGVQPLPAHGRHEQVDAGIDGGRTMVLVAALHLRVPVPVADDEALEAHATLEHVGQESRRAVHLLAVPARVGRHHREHARLDGRRIARAVQSRERRFVDPRIALVDAHERAAVAEEVLRTRRNTPTGARSGGCLQALDGRPREARDERGIRRKTLVAATPPHVLRYRDRRCEGPVDAGHGDLLGRRGADAPDEIRVVRRPESDVVRIDLGADDVVVAMDGIDAEHHRDRFVTGAWLERRRTKRLREPEPRRRTRALVVVRPRITPREDRAERVLPQILGGDGADVGLDDLTDLLLDTERTDEPCDARFGHRIDERRRFDGRPQRRVHLAATHRRQHAKPRTRRPQAAEDATTSRCLAHEVPRPQPMPCPSGAPIPP